MSDPKNCVDRKEVCGRQWACLNKIKKNLTGLRGGGGGGGPQGVGQKLRKIGTITTTVSMKEKKIKK